MRLFSTVLVLLALSTACFSTEVTKYIVYDNGNLEIYTSDNQLVMIERTSPMYDVVFSVVKSFYSGESTGTLTFSTRNNDGYHITSLRVQK